MSARSRIAAWWFEWTGEAYATYRFWRLRIRVATRRATRLEVLSWAAGEFGEQGDMDLKNLTLARHHAVRVGRKSS